MLHLAIWLFYVQNPATQKAPLLRPLPSVRTQQEIQQCARLKERISKVKQWHQTNDYTTEDWVYLLTLAQDTQKMPENIVYKALEAYRDIGDSRPYLLLKVMFYRPQPNVGDFIGLTSVGVYKYTISVRKEDIQDVPIDWHRGYPRFIASRIVMLSGYRESICIQYMHLNHCYSKRHIKIPRTWQPSYYQIKRADTTFQPTSRNAKKAGQR